jgi:carbonic anhydrase
VRALKVRDLVVMGHAMCGGIHALLHGAPAETSDFVGHWVSIAERAKLRALHFPPEKRQEYCERESVRLSLENLMTFPWVQQPVAAGTLTLHGCYFDIRSGILERLGDDGAFHAVSAEG